MAGEQIPVSLSAWMMLLGDKRVRVPRLVILVAGTHPLC